MNWLDIVIVVVLFAFAIAGFANGLIKAVLSLIGLVVGVILAGRFYVSLSGVLGFISNESAAKIVAFIIIFGVVMIIATILGILLTKVISAMLLGWLNRLLGAAFGVLEGFLFVGAILAAVVKVTGGSDLLDGSALSHFLLSGFPVVLSLLPGDFDSVRRFFQ